MRFSRTLNVADAHAEGESGKVVIGGLGPVAGQTMFDKRLRLEEQLDELRKLLLFEPPGAMWHNADVVLPSNHPDADAVVPSISGRAWITSFNQLVLDPTDPFQEGFVVGRPWEPER